MIDKEEVKNHVDRGRCDGNVGDSSRTSARQLQAEIMVVEEDHDSFHENPRSSNTHLMGPSSPSPNTKFGLEQQVYSFTNESSWNSSSSSIVREHFTLSNPASTISIGDKEAIVIVENLEQITLERSGDQVHVKQASLGSPGLLLMRCTYTFVAIFMSVIIFALSIQISLFLVLGVAIESGELVQTMK